MQPSNRGVVVLVSTIPYLYLFLQAYYLRKPRPKTPSQSIFGVLVQPDSGKLQNYPSVLILLQFLHDIGGVCMSPSQFKNAPLTWAQLSTFCSRISFGPTFVIRPGCFVCMHFDPISICTYRFHGDLSGDCAVLDAVLSIVTCMYVIKTAIHFNVQIPH